MDPADYLTDVTRQLRKYRELADAALAQVSDGDFARAMQRDSNTIAIIVKHLAGNMRSRWTDFLATDGEKPDRARDTEFILERCDDRVTLGQAWDAGWRTCLDAIDALQPDDLGRTVTIRGEAHTVLQAIQRQLTHYAYHVGQIVQLARHFAGPSWRSLSIPKGRSDEWEVSKDGSTYRP